MKRRLRMNKRKKLLMTPKERTRKSKKRYMKIFDLLNDAVLFVF